MSGSKLILRNATLNDRDWIEQRYLSYVPKYYDDSDTSYCDLWWESFFKNDNDLGFFSLSKEVLVIDDYEKRIGFFVITYKRGGSAKISPLILESTRSILFETWRLIEDYSRVKNVRKLYFDIPSVRWVLFRFLDPLQIRIEAHLIRHYSTKYDSIIGGKILFWGNNDSKNYDFITPNSKDMKLENNPKPRWLKLKIEHKIYFLEFINYYMALSYDEIDDSFVESIYKGMQYIHDGYKKKGKMAYIIFDENYGNIIALCIVTPKRGGAIKLSPLIFDQKLDFDFIYEAVYNILKIIYKKLNIYRKIYSLIPLHDAKLITVFQKLQFKIEGVLIEPYKEGVDFIVYSLFLKM